MLFQDSILEAYLEVRGLHLERTGDFQLLVKKLSWGDHNILDWMVQVLIKVSIRDLMVFRAFVAFVGENR